MARGITEEDVHQAADAIVTRGERPTIERIRAELGRGSPNTVNRHLDAWWATLPKRLAPQADGVPGEVVELARKIWAQLLPKATELAGRQLRDSACELDTRQGQIEQAEAELASQRIEFAQVRIALDRRIGELEAVLAARDEALQDSKRAGQRTGAELKAAQADAASARTALGKAQAAHAAEVSKLSERLAGTERRLMERLVEEKTARDVTSAIAQKRIKRLEEDLRAARKLLAEQSAASLRLQEALRSELDALRKLVSASPLAGGAHAAGAGRRKTRSKAKKERPSARRND